MTRQISDKRAGPLVRLNNPHALPKELLRFLAEPFAGSLKALANHSLASLMAVQAVGFIVVATHYARAGVPVEMIPAVRMFAAGVLFAILTSLPFVVGVYLQWERRRGSSGGKLVGWLQGALDVGPFMYIYPIAAYPVAPIIAYWLLLMVLGAWVSSRVLDGWLAPQGETNGSPSEDSGPAKWLPGMVTTIPIIAVLFSFVVMPTLPSWVGGGRFNAVLVHWKTKPSAIPDDATLFEVGQFGKRIYMAYDASPPPSRYLRGLWYWPSLRYFSTSLGAVEMLEYPRGHAGHVDK